MEELVINAAPTVERWLLLHGVHGKLASSYRKAFDAGSWILRRFRAIRISTLERRPRRQDETFGIIVDPKLMHNMRVITRKPNTEDGLYTYVEFQGAPPFDARKALCQ